MNLYDKVRKIATDRNISIYTIEKEAGLSNGSISKWNKSVPTLLNIISVTDYLDITIDELLNMEV